MSHELTTAYSQDSLLEKMSQQGKNGIPVLWEISMFNVCFPTSIYLLVSSQRQDHQFNIFVELMGQGHENRRLPDAPKEEKYLENHDVLILNAPNPFLELQHLG